MFCDMPGLAELEARGQWGDAVERLYQAWTAKKADSALLVRLIGECWYILDGWECGMPTERLSRSRIEQLMHEEIRYGQHHCAQKADYLCFVGYMLVMRPDLFDPEVILRGADPMAEGMRMMQRATQLAPENPVYKLLYLGYLNTPAQQIPLQRANQAVIAPLLADNTALTQYFREILLPRE